MSWLKVFILKSLRVRVWLITARPPCLSGEGWCSSEGRAEARACAPLPACCLPPPPPLAPRLFTSSPRDLTPAYSPRPRLSRAITLIGEHLWSSFTEGVECQQWALWSLSASYITSWLGFWRKLQNIKAVSLNLLRAIALDGLFVTRYLPQTFYRWYLRSKEPKKCKIIQVLKYVFFCNGENFLRFKNFPQLKIKFGVKIKIREHQ